MAPLPPSSDATRRGWACLTALCAALLTAAPALEAGADCALIPSALKRLPSSNGRVDRPFAASGDVVTVFADVACNPSLQNPFFDPIAANNEVSLVFEPPVGAVTPYTPFAASGVADCTALGGTPRCFALEFVVPDTTNFGPMATTGLPLTGPARIEVRNLAASSELVAEIGPLFERKKGCNAKNRFISIFEHFTVLPPRNGFGAGGATLLATVDGSGSLLIPFDYSAVLASASGGTAEVRILEVSGDLPNGLAAGNGLAGPDGAQLRVPRPSALSNFDFVRAFSLSGRPIPPLLEVVASTPLSAGGVEFGDTIIGSVDFVDSVIRLAKTGPDPSDPSSEIQVFALKGEQDPLAGLELVNGAGPIELAGLGLQAKGAAPLNSLRSSGEAAAIARAEALETPIPTDLNGDGDTLDRVVELIDLATGQSTSTGMAAVEVTFSPAKPVIATEGSLVTFLQSEAADGGIDRNGDGDAVDAIVRVFQSSGVEVTAGVSPPITGDPTARINGDSPLVISDGLLYFQRAETDESVAVTSGTSDGFSAPLVLLNEAASFSGDGLRLAVSFTLFDPAIGLPRWIASSQADLSLGLFTDGSFVVDTRVADPGCTLTTIPDGESANPSSSFDGSFVAYDSFATNLVPGGTNGLRQIHVAELDLAGIPTLTEPSCLANSLQGPIGMEIASQTAGGVQGDGDSAKPALGANARWVAFETLATNLVTPDSNGASDILVKDLLSGALVRLSQTPGGVEANGPSFSAAMTPDGRFVAFASEATNLVPGDTNGARDVFVVDRDSDANATLDDSTPTLESVSLGPAGVQANGISLAPALSNDGRFVAFHSTATNLVAADTNGVTDVFVHDRQMGATERVSVSSIGAQANGASMDASISGDGRFVAFESLATDLVGGDTNGASDVFRFDRVTRVLERVSVSSSGVQGDDASFQVALTPDGSGTGFASDASNLLDGLPDANPIWTDGFTRFLGGGVSLNGDGDLDDSVLTMLDVSGLPPTSATNTGLAVSQVAVSAGRALVLRDDGTPLLFGLGVLPGTVETQAFAVAASAVALSEGAACILSTAGAIHFGDPTAFPSVGLSTVAGVSDATSVKAVGPKCVFTTANPSLRIVEVGTAAVTNTGQPASDFQVDAKGIAFRSDESQLVPPTDLNGDLDTADLVMRFWDFAKAEDGDPTTEPLLETGRTAIPCDFPGCDPFFEPYRLQGGLLTFVSNEVDEVELGSGTARSPRCSPKAAAGVCDLTGNNLGGDVAVQLVSLAACSPEVCKAQVFPVDKENPPQVAPFPKVVAGDETVLAIQLPASLLGAAFEGLPPDQLVTVIAGDADGDGTFEEDGVLDEDLTVVDLCPEVVNPSQQDADADGLGTECDTALNESTGEEEPNDDPASPVPGAEAQIPGENLCDLDKSSVITGPEVDQVLAERGTAITAAEDTDGDGIPDQPTDDRDPDPDGEITLADFRNCLVRCQAQTGGCPESEPVAAAGGPCGLLGAEALLVLLPLWASRRRAQRRSR